MHALFVTVRFAKLLPSTQRELAHLSRKFVDVPGHLNTTWMRNGSTIALHQTFESASAADQYVASGILRDLVMIPGCRDLYVQEFEVVEGLRLRTTTRAAAETAGAEELVAVK